MEHEVGHTGRNATLVIFAALVALAAGCGDGIRHRSGGAVHSSLANHVKDRLGGGDVELVMHTSCEGVESADPATRCAGVRNAGVEVFFDGQSVIFDFANAAARGQISDSGFEGYVVSMPRGPMWSAIVDASVDGAESTVASEEVGLELDAESIAVNFSGLVYDDATFIKIDLVFDETS